jgi:hypothetical protein
MIGPFSLRAPGIATSGITAFRKYAPNAGFS